MTDPAGGPDKTVTCGAVGLPDEYVTVAVDFVPPGVFVAQMRPTRTVVVRARKRDLDARLLGQLSADDLRRRVEVSEY